MWTDWAKENKKEAAGIGIAVIIALISIIYLIVRMMRVSQEDLANANVQAGIKTLYWSENKAAASDDVRYGTIVGGQTFDDYSDHPRIMVTLNINGKPVNSDAAGAGQFLSTTYDWLKRIAGVTDFTPASQDLLTLQQIQLNGALDDLKAGNFQAFITKNANTWASFPGNNYDQSPNTVDALQQKFTALGGTINNAA